MWHALGEHERLILDAEHFQDLSLIEAARRASTIVIPLLGFPTDAGQVSSMRELFGRCSSLHEVHNHPGTPDCNYV